MWHVLTKLYVSFAKEPFNRDYILQKRPIILRSLLIVATSYLPCLSRDMQWSDSVSLPLAKGDRGDMTDLHVAWLIWDMTLSYGIWVDITLSYMARLLWHDSFIRDVTHMGHDSYGTWLFHCGIWVDITLSNMARLLWHDSFIRDVTHMGHDSYGTFLFHMGYELTWLFHKWHDSCGMTHSYVMWLIWDMTHMGHSSFICDMSWHNSFIYGTTHVTWRCDSYGTWLIWDIPLSYAIWVDITLSYMARLT